MLGDNLDFWVYFLDVQGYLEIFPMFEDILDIWGSLGMFQIFWGYLKIFEDILVIV